MTLRKKNETDFSVHVHRGPEIHGCHTEELRTGDTYRRELNRIPPRDAERRHGYWTFERGRDIDDRVFEEWKPGDREDCSRP